MIYVDKKISTLEQLKTRIEKTKHFNDIDSMWRTIKSQGEEIGGFSGKLEKLSDQLTEKINDMLAFKEEIERAECRSAYFAAGRYFMMENKREKNLINMASKLDAITNSDGEITKLAFSIVEDKDDSATVELCKKIFGIRREAF